VRRGDKQNQITKGLPQILKGYASNGYSLFSCVNYRMKSTPIPTSGKIPCHAIPQSKLPTINGRKTAISTKLILSIQINQYHRSAKTMKKEQQQQIADYYSTTDKYIRSMTHFNAHQSVFTKESDRYQWLVLEQKSQSEAGVRQTDNHRTITVGDNYELTRNMPKCVSVERLCECANFQIPFNADEINLIYQFGEQGKAETCANLSAILPQIKDNQTKQIVCTTLDKLNSPSETSCKELTATTKSRKIAGRDHSIRTRLQKQRNRQNSRQLPRKKSKNP